MSDPTTNTVKRPPLGGLNDPVNLQIMDVDAFIGRHGIKQVSSTMIFESSSTTYNVDGLYSEEIFGYIGTKERMTSFGRIELNTPIFHPKIFAIICKLAALYKDIISGAAYAVFDPVTKNFERVVGDPLDTPGCDTGYSFFMQHFYEIEFEKRDSLKRNESIDVIEKYKDLAIMRQYLVEPAGLRDISNDNTNRLVQDEINKIYTSLLMYTRSIPKGTQSVLYDLVRWQIQSKAQEIYEYIENFLDGKRGFIQSCFARRNVALSTRNVITAAPCAAASPDDPRMIGSDDVMVGVYQTIKGLLPFTKHVWNTAFARPVFKAPTSTTVSLVDLKTKELVATTISQDERDKWTAAEQVEKIINGFRNPDTRALPILVEDESGVKYGAIMVYDDGDTIAFCRSKSDLEERWGRKVYPEKLRPITYIELFYVIADTIVKGKHATITRYPVIEQGSSYVAVPHVVSTSPSRKVSIINLLAPGSEPVVMAEYPILGAPYMDAMMVHPSKLAGMGGD